MCYVVIFTYVVCYTGNMDVDFPVLDLEELKSAFASGGVEECRRLLERKRDEWKDIPLNVAVIGNSDVDRFSFINAIRGLTADDERTAGVDVIKTTIDIESYSHPNNPLLKFWELPGVGTVHFPRQTYLSDIDFDRFDFFLLLTADRFTENDTWLGNELSKRKKKHFFVRTNIGVDIECNKKAHPRTHDEEAVLKEIRESIQHRLRIHNVSVFLIDRYKIKKFDFDKLKLRLLEEFPKLKKTALVLSLQATCEGMLRLKVAELRSRMWKLAALSGAVAAPVPGLSTVFDLSIVTNEAKFYFTQLGLDETSLKRFSKLTSTDYQQLQSTVDSCLDCRIVGTEGLKKHIVDLLKRADPVLTSAAVDVDSKFVPLLGSFIAAPLSFGGTYYALKLVLDKMESAALEVIQFAAETRKHSAYVGSGLIP